MVWSFTSFDVLRSERYGKYGQNGHCEKLVGPVWEGKPTNYMLGRMMWHGASLKVGLWQYRGTRATPDADGAIPHYDMNMNSLTGAAWLPGIQDDTSIDSSYAHLVEKCESDFRGSENVNKDQYIGWLQTPRPHCSQAALADCFKWQCASLFKISKSRCS